MEKNNLDKIKKYLLEEERILWSGKSDSKKLLNKRYVFLIPISIIWGIFILYWSINDVFIIFNQ